jgi:hypothetical protein
VALLIGCLVLRTSVIAQPSRNADGKRDDRGTLERAADVNAAFERIIAAARIP